MDNLHVMETMILIRTWLACGPHLHGSDKIMSLHLSTLKTKKNGQVLTLSAVEKSGWTTILLFSFDRRWLC